MRLDDEHDVVGAFRDPLRDGLHLSRAINHRPFQGRKPEVGLQPVPVRLLWGAADRYGGLPSHEGEKRPTGLDNLGFLVETARSSSSGSAGSS